jgi:hypothetical protein
MLEIDVIILQFKTTSNTSLPFLEVKTLINESLFRGWTDIALTFRPFLATFFHF